MRDEDTAAGSVEPPDAGTDSTGIVVLNPVAGGGDHAPQVHDLAGQYGYEVRETDAPGEAADIAADAATGADLVAACGGDGTVHEVVRGLRRTDALDDVTLGVVPAGTGNNFAENIGIESIEHAFEVLADGEVRRVDLGTATAETPGEEECLPFVNSCVCGLTAEASESTDPDEKSRLGVLAYVQNTVREAVGFDGIPMEVRTSDEIERQWSGSTTCILVGNGRRFLTDGRTQADMEDGLLEVTIFEGDGALDLAGSLTVEQLLGDGSAADVTRLRTPALEVTVEGDEPANFSLDGEMLTARELTIETHRQSVWLGVGGTYEPEPGRPAEDDAEED